jgi:exodeoxyribonuclease V beta subunit
VNFKKFLAYSASAGSGKTYALSIRYIALLFLEQNPSSILAATFTKKAANEMRQRVLKFLKALPSDSELTNSLIEASGLSREDILKKQPQVLNRFLKSQSYIVTLDSFFNSILRACALEIGLDANFAIKDNAHETLQEHFLFELDKNKDIIKLSKLAINLQKRKAKDIMELLKLLYELDAILPESNYVVENIDSLKIEILELKDKILDIVKRVGASNSAINIFAKDDFKEFIKQGVFEKDSLSEHRYFKKYLPKAPELDDMFIALKELIANYHLKIEQSVLYYLFEIYNSYKNARVTQIRATNELDFNDILYYTYRLISNEVTKDFIYFKLDSKFKHILLDEFQDTSSLQFLILEPLIEEIFSGLGSSEFRSFFYVGDTKQSLYRFRGGVEELFEYLANKYNIDIENLDTNYRSAKSIVDFTNKTFKDNIKGYVEQKANSNITGYVEVLESSELLEKAKDRVEFYLQQGVKLEDIAVLVFANKDGVVLQEYLEGFNISSILKTSSSLKHNPKIAALVGVIEFILTDNKLFLEPFLMHIKRDSIDLSDIKISTTPFDALDILVMNYGYFANDLNILKLLDFAKSYSTLEEFLYEFKRSNIALSESSQNGLQIMTIHGSKGLEFKYVIVLDRLGGRAIGSNLLIFKNRTPVSIEKIYYKSSKKENFLRDYKKVLLESTELAIKDRLNLLYVAITRAELALSIIKKDKMSEFELLKLDEQKIGEIAIFEQKKSREYKKLSSTISYYGLQDTKESKEEIDEVINYESIYFGEALHLALELSNLNALEYSDAIDAMENKFGYILSKESIEDIKKRVEKLFCDSRFLNLIDNAKLYKEQPFVFKEKFYQIDLLAKKDTENIIIDYKSSTNFRAKHIEQVTGYVEAIKSIDKKIVKGYIVYLLKKGIEILEI